MSCAARSRGLARVLSCSLAGALLPLLGALPAAALGAGLPAGRGALLPLQDRVGEPALAELVETLLARRLAEHAELTGPAEVRGVLRDLRIRDASDEPPERLAALAERLGAEWFFLATLHEAAEGQLPLREDGTLGRTLLDEGAGSTPQVVLSARLFRRGSDELWWAGFQAASGRDPERAFGRGEIETLDELLVDAVEELVTAALDPGPARRKPRLRHRWEGYSRPGRTPAPPARVAVIPLDSVAERSPAAAAEVATAALYATLDDRGFRPLLPGLVRAIRQHSGRPHPGGTSRSEWEALAREGGAEWVVTGTVETYRRGVGRDPNPWVAFSVRFVNPGDGRIDWLAGLGRSGRETASAFDRGRIYTSGGLTYELMRSLFNRIEPLPNIARAGLGD